MKNLKTILAAALTLVFLTACSDCKTTDTMKENNTLETLKTRRAIRQYQDRMPEKALLDQVLEAGTYAPTGRGKQAPIIVAVTNKEVRDRLSQLNAQVMGTDKDPFYGAPVVLVVLAHALGLGSCWIHRAKEVFDMPEGKQMLKDWGIEGNYEGIGNCIIGYTEGQMPEAAPRKADYIYWVD